MEDVLRARSGITFLLVLLHTVSTSSMLPMSAESSAPAPIEPLARKCWCLRGPQALSDVRGQWQLARE